MDYYAKYILALFVPWVSRDDTFYDFTVLGLCCMLDEWDRWSAPLVYRQRLRLIKNFMNKSNRSSPNETICGAWRDRNADMWSAMRGYQNNDSKDRISGGWKSTEYDGYDEEADGVLRSEELACVAYYKPIKSTMMDICRICGHCVMIYMVFRKMMLECLSNKSLFQLGISSIRVPILQMVMWRARKIKLVFH